MHDIISNLSYKLMEQNFSMVIAQTPPLSISVSAHNKLHYQFHMMFYQTHQEFLYFKKVFQEIHSKFVEAIDPLQNHST